MDVKGTFRNKNGLVKTGISWSELASQAFFGLFRLEGSPVIIAIFTEHSLKALRSCGAGQYDSPMHAEGLGSASSEQLKKRAWL